MRPEGTGIIKKIRRKDLARRERMLELCQSGSQTSRQLSNANIGSINTVGISQTSALSAPIDVSCSKSAESLIDNSGNIPQGMRRSRGRLIVRVKDDHEIHQNQLRFKEEE